MSQTDDTETKNGTIIDWTLRTVIRVLTLFTPICLYLNKKVGFKRPTTSYCKNSILCGALLSGAT